MNSTTIKDCSTIDIMGLEEDTLYTINVTASMIPTVLLQRLQRQVGKAVMLILPLINY